MLQKITDADLEGRGVIGQAAVPGLSVLEMQESVEEIVREVVIPAFNANVDEQTAVNGQILRKDNADAYTPAGDYQPATKKYVDDAQFASGSVSSVFGRAGHVLAQRGDYVAGMVELSDYSKGISDAALQTGDTVQEAFGKLEVRMDSAESGISGISGTLEGVGEDVSAHIADTANPHSVTYSQVGASPALTWQNHTGDGATPGTLQIYSNWRSIVTAYPSITLQTTSGISVIENCWLRVSVPNDAAAFSVTFPAGTEYIGSIPVWEAGKTYEIDIQRGVAVIAEVGDGS